MPSAINTISTSTKFADWVTAINAMINGVQIDSNGAISGTLLWASNAEAQAKASALKVLTPSNLAALDASTSFKGFTQISTDAIALTGTSTTVTVTPANVKYVLDNRPASTSGTGLVELATNAEAQAKSGNLVVTAGNLSALGATTTFAGFAELATDAEALAKASSTVLTASNLAALDATTSFKGMIQISTDAVALTGTSTVLSVSPANLKYVLDNRAANDTTTGLVRFATTSEHTTPVSSTIAVNPAGMKAYIDTRVGTNAAGTRYISTSTPSGGNDGDIWYQVSA